MAIKKSQQGFTLIEMLVVIAIFAVVSTVLLFHYSDFSTNVGVANLAEEIGLSIRKAQTYATSVRSIDGTDSVMSDMFPAYGISFSVNATSSKLYDPTASGFVLFADAVPSGQTTNDDIYENNGTCGNPAVGSECVENFGITGGNVITSLCTGTDSGDNCDNKTVNVVFRRPDPDAVICVPDGLGGCGPAVSDLKVTVQSVKGITHVITVWNTGQISIN